MQMPSLAFAKLSLGPPILITNTTTQLVLNIIYFINPIKRTLELKYEAPMCIDNLFFTLVYSCTIMHTQFLWNTTNFNAADLLCSNIIKCRNNIYATNAYILEQRNSCIDGLSPYFCQNVYNTE